MLIQYASELTFKNPERSGSCSISEGMTAASVACCSVSLYRLGSPCPLPDQFGVFLDLLKRITW